MSCVPADAAFLNITGRYYVRRCDGLDPEESLEDGTAGPSRFKHATGALLLEAPNGTNARAIIMMRGIVAVTPPFAHHTPELFPQSRGAKPMDGLFQFVGGEIIQGGARQPMGWRAIQGTHCDLKLQISSKVDANGDAILPQRRGPPLPEDVLDPRVLADLLPFGQILRSVERENPLVAHAALFYFR